MNIEHRIEILKEKKLVGKHIRMSFTNNRTKKLWQSFMPFKKEIKNSMSQELFSVEVFDDSFFIDFNHDNEFEKWAAVEVSNYESVPYNMETLILPEGKYAVFIHKGAASEGPKTYQYIFLNWLPASEYIIDNRPHFALMGEKYKGEDPDSEEEIWIPIK